MEAIRRGFAIAIAGGIGRIARPLAVIALARVEGAEIAAATIVAWSAVEIAGGLARVGAHRALQRDPTPERALASLVVVTIAGMAAGLIATLATPHATAMFGASAIIGATLLVALAQTLLVVGRGTTQTADRVAGDLAASLGLVVAVAVARGNPLVGAAAMAAVAVITTQRALGWRAIVTARDVSLVSLARTAFPIGIGDILQLVVARGDILALPLLGASPGTIVGYSVARELVDAFTPLRDAIDQVITPLVDRHNARSLAATVARWSLVIGAPVVVIAVVGPVAGPVVIALALGRLIDLATSSWRFALAVVAPPALSAIAPAVGLVATIATCIALDGTLGVAIAVGLGLAITNLVARHLLLEDCA